MKPVSEETLDRVVASLRSFGARRVLLFGSYADSPEQARDIDLAVEGIPLARLLDADAAILDILDAPYDLVSREDQGDFYDLISPRARVLFDQDAA
jgi:predicted nucleotidyltransferase